MVAGSPLSGSPLSGPVVSSCLVSPGLTTSAYRLGGRKPAPRWCRSLTGVLDGGAVSRSSAGAPLALAAVLILVAVLVAPEQPQDQEAICQRHNGVAACRVW